MDEHPAKFSKSILAEIRQMVKPGWRVLDPFAGTGKIDVLREVGVETWGVEIEPEWAMQSPYTVVGNALSLPFGDQTFDASITSCTYGNRMADHHQAKDPCKKCDGAGCKPCRWRGLSWRNTYTHVLGRKLHPDNSGAMQWGPAYRDFHEAAWKEVTRVTREVFILNVSDHIRGDKRQPVAQWHFGLLQRLGWHLEEWKTVATPRQRNGQNAHLRVDGEEIARFVR